MKPMLVTSGEPAGIGPDLCLDLVNSRLPIVVVADRHVLEERAEQLKRKIEFKQYKNDGLIKSESNVITYLHVPCPSKVNPGQLNANNATYVLDMLALAADRCLSGEFSALITAPIHKGILNQPGVNFTGHTEFFAERFGIETVVMMLVCDAMRVALVTTHLALRDVPNAITSALIEEVVICLNRSLQRDFLIPAPELFLAGLNPHAGEGGYLGSEEIDIIIPAVKSLQNKGINVQGPFPADTMFTPKHQNQCDAFIAMYHDQGLSVLKYAGFGNAVNITLGLPIIRTSVDHGTALDLAGKGMASSSSLIAALNIAAKMVKSRNSDEY